MHKHIQKINGKLSLFGKDNCYKFSLFWHESWMGGEVLEERFSSMFNLGLRKIIM